jgi:hypothetical protein
MKLRREIPARSNCSEIVVAWVKSWTFGMVRSLMSDMSKTLRGPIEPGDAFEHSFEYIE